MAEPQLAPRKKVRSSKAPLAGTIVLVGMIIVSAAVLYRQYLGKPNETPVVMSAPAVATTEEPVTAATAPDVEPQALYDSDVMVAEDHYELIKLTLKSKTEISYEYQVNSGPNLDFYMVDDDGLFKWKRVMEGAKETQFMTYGDFKSSATSRDKKSGLLNAGTYYLIIDNTDYGDVMPPMNLADDVATLHLTVVGR
ncbi:hypothetical protein [Paenibacillus sp. OV219]|uniref:hypothetical protein n=1 Tax=Paenibacillus sp. OV219 TaxID=1884377 RepID=UPI0008BF8509|nr:hypothetical protein [Paenibacillus sp. OV219]SEP17337.1 hypothetical protein SAMN05518847_1254 [Paenibacillus sp. OV219]